MSTIPRSYKSSTTNDITLHIRVHKNAALCDRQCHLCCKPAATSAVGHANGPVRVQLTDWGLLSVEPAAA